MTLFPGTGEVRRVVAGCLRRPWNSCRSGQEGRRQHETNYTDWGLAQVKTEEAHKWQLWAIMGWQGGAHSYWTVDQHSPWPWTRTHRFKEQWFICLDRTGQWEWGLGLHASCLRVFWRAGLGSLSPLSFPAFMEEWNYAPESIASERRVALKTSAFLLPFHWGSGPKKVLRARMEPFLTCAKCVCVHTHVCARGCLFQGCPELY